MIWVMVLIAAVLLNFVPNKLFNSGCSHVYRGLVMISVAALIGISDHDFMAATVLIVGLVIAQYGKSYEH